MTFTDSARPAPSTFSNTRVIGRRQFLISSAVFVGGCAFGISPEQVAKGAAKGIVNGPWGADTRNSEELSAWIEILSDDSVVLRVPTPEIGNGATTQVAMNITEELGCAWSKVRIEFSSMHRDYLEQGVYTSGTLPFFGGHGTDHTRMGHALQLGASARERLKAAAAKRWNVSPDEIEARESVLTHKPSGRRLSYGDVAIEAAQVELSAEPALKPQSEWTFLGKASPAKLNIPEIVTGKAVYGIDVQVPGMVYAAIMQVPVQGGRLKSHKPEAVMDMPGVRAVVVVDPSKTVGVPEGYQFNEDDSKRLPFIPRMPKNYTRDRSTWGLTDNQAQSAVAVIADHYWQAKKALAALPVEWDLGTGTQWQSADDIYRVSRKLHETEDGMVVVNSGDVSAVKGKVVEGLYSTPYCENAAMEPLGGTALVTEDRAEVWCSTQDSLQAYWTVIDETGLPPEQVHFHQAYVGGGFGRRTMADDIRMVAAVAREYPGVPVKTIWSREECFRQGRYRAPVSASFKAVLGKDGYPSAVTTKSVFVGDKPQYILPIGYADSPYFISGAIPNVQLSLAKYPVHILNGAFRGPGFNSNAFLVETFIDECAVAAGIDPLEYRINILSKWDQTWVNCLRVAAEKAGWGTALPKGEGRGIAITAWPAGSYKQFGTIICSAARVKVSKQGELEVKQVDVAFDCGRVANRDAVINQLEGGTIFGMNFALNEQITIEKGAVVEGNFDQYPMLRVNSPLPKINVHFEALSGHDRFAIIGESPVGPIGPAIGNAIYQATGKRVRSTPFCNHDLSWS